ncbi:MarR family winged helix-turn-helix transcriptional regulator [Actinophytocola sp.]|uniref:MarR family winged helix-turn-helix transcriptional regulator n=1 Tax=Actinophytocola sp. TaxID=1872138 RepID=UPI00389B063B
MRSEQDLAELSRLVREGVGRLSWRMRAARERGGPTGLELAVLRRLYRAGTHTPTALADAEQIHPQSLTRVLAALDRDGFVTRRPDPTDGRRVLVEISTRGLEALRTYSEQRERWLAAAMADTLSETEQDLLGLAARLMVRIADS